MLRSVADFAIRRPLLILIVMTVVMFIINIAQLATMNHVVGTLWLTLFPALIFAAFLLAFSIVCWKQQRKPDNTLPLLAFQKHRCMRLDLDESLT